MNWAQLRGIVWLRWRLTRNQFSRSGQVSAILSVLLQALTLVAGAGLGVGGLAAGLLVGAKAPPQVLLLVWDGILFVFLVFWATGLMVEIQRSESIDLTKLLHLPVTLNQVFVFNYAVSHVTPSIVLFLPAMLGLSVGSAFGGGPALLLLAPLVLSFIFLVTAWTYCLRGWLTALMVNKRRRRAIIVWITVAFVLVFQIPNLIFNSPWFHQKRPHRQAQHQTHAPATNHTGAARARPEPREGLALPEGFVQAHLALPPGWVGYGAMCLKDGNPWPALGATLVSSLLGMLGMARAYRLTLRFYQGAEGATATEPVPQRDSRPCGRMLVERHLPWVPDDTAALALATFRSLTRSPELKMAFIMPIVVGAMLAASHFARPRHPPTESLVGFAVTLAAAAGVYFLTPSMANTFGLDRNGFRALVLLPVRRHHILLAKNLAFFPFVSIAGVALLVLTGLLLHPSGSALLTGLVQLPTTYLLLSPICNLFSILAPYRLAEGTLRAKRPKLIVFVAAFGTMLFAPIALLPILIPPGLNLLFASLDWMPWLPVNVLAAVVILAGVAWLYGAVLPLEGRLLQRREQTILRAVTEEVE